MWLITYIHALQNLIQLLFVDCIHLCNFINVILFQLLLMNSILIYGKLIEKEKEENIV